MTFAEKLQNELINESLTAREISDILNISPTRVRQTVSYLRGKGAVVQCIGGVYHLLSSAESFHGKPAETMRSAVIASLNSDSPREWWGNKELANVAGETIANISSCIGDLRLRGMNITCKKLESNDKRRFDGSTHAYILED